MSSKEQVYGAFIDYYGDIPLEMIKNDNGWVIYCTKVQSGLNDNRYIFVIVKASRSLPIKTTLNELDWVCFQTRTSQEVYQVPMINMNITESNRAALSDKITVVNRTKEETNYVTNSLPIKIRLMHDMKKNNYLQYPDSVLLYQALNTFNCVVDLL